MTNEKATPEQPDGQAETPKPLTLSAIETMLLDAEMQSIANQINGCIRALRTAAERIPGWGGELAEVKKEVARYLWDGSFDRSDLRKSLSVTSRNKLAERVAESFLAKVSEIEEIAHQAASREG